MDTQRIELPVVGMTCTRCAPHRLLDAGLHQGPPHPAMAAGAMAGSSVTVVLNSLRLGRRRI